MFGCSPTIRKILAVSHNSKINYLNHKEVNK